MLCLIVFNGFPSILIRTNFYKNPTSLGRSCKSLLLKSNVLSYCNLQIFKSNSIILLFFKSNTLKFGALRIFSAFKNLSLLKDNKIVSSLTETGISWNSSKKFSDKFNNERLFNCSKLVGSINLIWFLFSKIVSNKVTCYKQFFYISYNLLLLKSMYLSAFKLDKTGNYSIRLNEKFSNSSV